MKFDKFGALPMKRQSNDHEKNERPRKRAVSSQNYIEINNGNSSEKVYKFRILLPIGLCLGLRIREPEFMEMPVKEFIEIVKDEYYRVAGRTEHLQHNPERKKVNWNNRELRFIDANDHEIIKMIDFRRFKPNENHFLRLRDGSKEADTYENMWDLTPDTELLMELPAEYTFETALADLIDNSLQAVWSNGMRERRLVSVQLSGEKISIFDTGLGMDGSAEKNIVKWGKMGASLNRSSRGDGIGGNPPYLTPFFGMFGYGGSMASMHLGWRALVSSKTKESKKVYTLHLQRDALLSSSGSEKTWRTDGGIRDPTDDEISESPHGSFTKVEIFEPRLKGADPVQLQSRLKDIYFPYIQCDERSKTITPIEFEVNGTNLAEIEGGEVAITNLESCNGPNFVLQLHFSQDVPATSGQGLRASQKANARLKFVYFPMVKGKESIEMILEKLKGQEYSITESFDSFSRVSIRRLGRLLPDARWNFLPFMQPKQQRGDKALILKRCCRRVKCFIDTDAGFNPTPSKTDLAHHHLFTTALKNFGDKALDKGDLNATIYKDQKEVTLMQLEKQYQEWLFQMHDQYDKEVECGEDQPVLVLRPLNKKKLGISSDVLRVHKAIPRKGSSWKSGQKIKLLKGAGAGVHKNNVYATLEYILLEGFPGDTGGEARLICRPLDVPKEKGCKLTWNKEDASIDIGDSLSLPMSIIDHDQCLAINAADWEKQVEKQSQKQPSVVEMLNVSDCQELGIDGSLPSGSTLVAGHTPPNEIVAVVRPASFISASGSKSLDQKYIVRDDLEIILQIKYNGGSNGTPDDHIYSGNIKPSSRKGYHGLYVFPLGCKFPDIFKKAGVYTLSLSLRGSRGTFERKIEVKALSEVRSWKLLTNGRSPSFIGRVGSCFPPISIACYDAYKNHIPFPAVPEITIEVRSGKKLLADINETKLDLASDKFSLTIKDALVESNKLDCVRPNYECTLIVSSKDGKLAASIPCQVLPGDLKHIKVQPKNLDKKLIPGYTIEELTLEMFDGYGNRIPEGLEFSLRADGFCLVDHIGPLRKVDGRGGIDLSGLLKVTGGYGSGVSLSVFLGEEIVFKKDFKTEERELRIASMVQQSCMAGSLLENLTFEIVNSEGHVDESFHDDEKSGQSHTLKLKSDSSDADDSVRYSFRHGRCMVRAISVPQNEGTACFVAAHSRHPELSVTFKVNVLKAPDLEPEINAQQSYGETLLIRDSPAYQTRKLENGNSCSPILKYVDKLVISNLSDMKELEHNLVKYGKAIGAFEETQEKLDHHCLVLEEDISILQASLEPISTDDSGCAFGKEQIVELINEKKETAASIICKTLRGDIMAQKYFKDNILGVVALMGAVQTNGLSRILSEYLGEDHMLAVVCKSCSSDQTLEHYDKNGNVDKAKGLHAIAADIGVSIGGRYLILNLEEVRPYRGVVSNDPQMKLKLPDPTLPSGITPPGYLGYAVNMISLDEDHWHVRTRAGRGLRETLFYRLFGELQVYETRAHMNMARDFIKYGAVSLDGGIMRDGVFSLGDWQSQICFPVITSGSATHLSPCNVEIIKQIKEKKMELRSNRSQMEKMAKAIKKLKKKFEPRKERYEKFLGEKFEALCNLAPP